MSVRILYVVTEDWYFLSHRLPMARAAKAAGYEIHVATRLREGGTQIEKEGFIAHGLSWTRGSLSPRDSISALRELRQLLRDVRPDIIHNVSLKPVLLGSIASLGQAPYVVNSLTGIGSLFIDQGRISRLTRYVVRIVLGQLLRRTGSTTIVQNPDDRAFVHTLGVVADHVVLIRGSGVDTERLQPLPQPPLPVTAAFVGRMLADKGVPTLIEAFSRVRRNGLQLALLLAGDCDIENPGSLKPEQLREAGQVPGIRWLGHVSDVGEVWRKAHFAVLPSRREGLPKALLEAAACGRPMVATDAPGCREIAIEGLTALTVPIDDVEALAEAMTRMTFDCGMRENFARAARQIVEREFSAEVVGRETLALYNRILERR